MQYSQNTFNVGASVHLAHPLAYGLQIHYNFNEFGGVRINNRVSSKAFGTLNNFALNPTTTSGRVGGQKLGNGALISDGTDDYVQMVTADMAWVDSSSLTVSMWLKSTDNWLTGYAFSRGYVDATRVFGMDFAIGATNIDWARNTGDISTYRISRSSGTPLSLTGWNHFVFIYDKTIPTRYHFLNGVKQTVTYPNSAESANNISYNASFDAGWCLCATRRNTGDLYGKLVYGEFRLYNRVLSDNEAYALYANTNKDYMSFLKYAPTRLRRNYGYIIS